MADSPTDIDGVFAFKRQNVAKERFYSVVHSPPPFAPAGAPARRRPFCHYFTDRLQRVGVNTVFPLCFPERSRGTAEIDAAFASFAQEPPDALFVAADAFFNSRRAQFATLTIGLAPPNTSAMILARCSRVSTFLPSPMRP